MIDHEIISDGVTVWVNTAILCIGRFGRMGIDVHRGTIEEQRVSECLDCTHGPVSPEDWERFKSSMLKFHGVVVGDEHRPKHLLKCPVLS